MTQDQHQELAHLRAEVDRLQAEVSRGITALAECIGQRDKAYKAGMLRAAQVCRNVASIHSNPSIIEAWTQAAERIEAEIEQISREKASLVQIIRDKHAALTKVEADSAAMRERMKELEHSDQMWDEHMSPFTDYEGDEAPWKTMAREFETLRATAQRRLELLRRCEWGMEPGAICRFCRRQRLSRHAPDCPLAKEIQSE